MRKHLSLLAAIAIVAFALSGCTGEEPYRKQSEVPSDEPSITASQSENPSESPTDESPTDEEQSSPTGDTSPEPSDSPMPVEPNDDWPASPLPAVECDIVTADWSTASVNNFGNAIGGDPTSSDTSGKIYAIDIGRHDCFDRIVIRVDSDQQVGFRAEYVDAVRTPGKGDAVLLDGQADMRILVQAWVADTNGLYSLNVETASWDILRQVVQAGSFEGQTTIGVGVDSKQPFRAFYLPTDDGQQMRIVIDIAHHPDQ